MTVPPKIEDLTFVENWITDGLGIGRNYLEIAKRRDPPTETWKRNEFRRLLSERNEWFNQYPKCRQLAFRLDPPPPPREDEADENGSEAIDKGNRGSEEAFDDRLDYRLSD